MVDHYEKSGLVCFCLSDFQLFPATRHYKREVNGPNIADLGMQGVSAFGSIVEGSTGFETAIGVDGAPLENFPGRTIRNSQEPDGCRERWMGHH